MLWAMIKVGDIRTFEDETFLRSMMRASVAALAAGLALAAVLAGALAVLAPEALDPAIRGLASGDVLGLIVAVALSTVAAVPAFIAHELVHGALFKLFAPAGARVTFGANWKMGMVYACAENIVYTRGQYLAVALAPTVAVTAVALAIGAAVGAPVAGAYVAALHLSGCAGDWGYAAAIIRDPAIRYCEDTDFGVAFYGEGDACGDARAAEASSPMGTEGRS